MRRHLFILALLLVPGLAAATEQRSFEGQFRVTYRQPQCVRPPCPGNWILVHEAQQFVVASLDYDPATPAEVREALTRLRPFNPVLVEGSAQIEGHVATILARSYRPAPGR